MLYPAYFVSENGFRLKLSVASATRDLDYSTGKFSHCVAWNIIVLPVVVHVDFSARFPRAPVWFSEIPVFVVVLAAVRCSPVVDMIVGSNIFDSEPFFSLEVFNIHELVELIFAFKESDMSVHLRALSFCVIIGRRVIHSYELRAVRQPLAFNAVFCALANFAIFDDDFTRNELL